MLFQTRAIVCLTVFCFAFPSGAQTIGGCPVFPSNNIWNARVDTLPVHSRSSAWVTSIGPTATLHQDFGATPYNGVLPGLPINLVTGSQPKVPMIFKEGLTESDPGPYPFAPDAAVEGGADRHVLVVDTTNCLLYETYYSFKNPDNSWTAYSGAIFDLKKNLLRPQTWTSADAAGLPITAGLARYEEIAAGEIKHALRFTAPNTVREYLWPARHFASSSTDLNRPPMGARFRLKANFDISGFSQTTQIILTGLKRYGMMLADNGGSWYMQGTYDPSWPDLADEWRRIPGSAFEAVDVSSLMENVDSAAVKGSTVPTPALSSVAVSPTAVTGGQGASLTVTLSSPAPAGGTQVTLSSSGGGTVAPSVVVVEGLSTASVPVSTSAVSAQTTVTLSATLAGVTKSTTLTLNPPAPALQTASFLVSSITGGQGATLRLTLSGPAPDGATIALTSDNSSVAWSASSVQVASGGSSVDVAVTTSPVQSQTQVTFNATLNGTSLPAVLIVNPAAPAAALASVSLTPSAVLGGTGSTLQVSLTQPAPAGGFVVTLSSGTPAAASVPATVTVQASQSAATVPVATSPVSVQTQVVLTASAGSVTQQATLTVNPPALSGLSVSPGSVQGGSSATGTVSLSGKAPVGGFVVALSSNNTAAASTPASVPVPAGASSVTFAISTSRVSVNTTVQIQASAQGRTAVANLQVTAAGKKKSRLTTVSATMTSAGLAVTASLDEAAGSEGALVGLAASDNSVVNLAGRVIRVAPGSSSATATFPVTPSGADATVTVTAAMDGATAWVSVQVPKTAAVVVQQLLAPAVARVNRWAIVTVQLSGPPAAGAPVPTVSVTGVVKQTQWIVPIAPGRTWLALGVLASSQGTGTVSVSLGDVTKAATITAQ